MYAAMIEQSLRRAPIPVGSGVEAGLVYADAVIGNRTARTAPIPNGKICDSSGHARSVYRPLLIYSLLQASMIFHEGASEPAVLIDEAARLNVSLPDRLTASVGDHVAEIAWNALARHASGLDVRSVFARLASEQQPSGAFLQSTTSDQPETLWYHELQILHALASYTAQSIVDPRLRRAIEKAAVFHLNETQPDHATTQPWGLLAFIQTPDANLLADQMLHAANLQQPDRIDGVSLMLLADCLYCLRRSQKDAR